MKRHYFKINNLLNQKLVIKPKLRKIKFDKEKNDVFKNLLKPNNKNLLEMEEDLGLKPIKYYFKSVKNNNINKTNKKNNIITKTTQKKINNNSLILSKNNSIEDNNIYEVIDSKDNKNKIIYANKLIIDDNNNKDNKENDLYRKKISDNMASDFIKLFGSNYRNLRRRLKITSLSIKNKNAKAINYISDDEMKLLTKNGIERMIYRKTKDFSNKIKNAIKEIESNKENFQNILDINEKIYLKNKQYALNDAELAVD